jgi:hypothetical protein
MQIDLKRGLLRAWVVVAVAWISLMGWSEYNQVPEWAKDGFDPDAYLACWDRLAKWPDGTPLAKRLDLDDELEPSTLPPGYKLDRNRWRAEIRQKLGDCEAAIPLMHRLWLKVSSIWSILKSSIPFILGPPVALLIAGYIIGWVVRGFRAQA